MTAKVTGQTVDLRSDTVSVPTASMLRAMMSAKVGDDVYGEDPTANRLEAMVAEMLGKEASIFVSSGTMGNLLSIRAQTQPGDEVIMDVNSHTYHYETGGYAALAGVGFRFIDAEKGIIRAEQIAPLVRPENLHYARTRAVLLENTHNRGGGTVYPVKTVAEIGEACRKHGLKLHMDGARLFDACVAAGCKARDYAQHVDTVTFCLSKSLGCPVGSMIAGERDVIARIRKLRHQFGGAMRQIGYLAAAGIYALENNISRLAEDHENARLLADGVRETKGLRLLNDPPETNMVYFEVLPPHDENEFYATMKAEGMLIGGPEGNPLRAVTHIGITRHDIERTVAALQKHYG